MYLPVFASKRTRTRLFGRRATTLNAHSCCHKQVAKRALFSMVSAVVEAVMASPAQMVAKVNPAATAAGMVLSEGPAHADTLS